MYFYKHFLHSDKKAIGDHNESVLASYLETSTASQAEQPQICKLIGKLWLIQLCM